MDICEKKGHKFEARYDEEPSGTTVKAASCPLEAYRTLLFYNTYVHDICVRCGKVIKRGKQ